MEAEEDTLSYDGCFSLEVFNTGSEKISGYECNMALYDKFLRKGKFLYVHGADDNHNKAPFGDLTAAPSPTRSWTCRPSASTSISRSTRPMEKPPIPGRSGGQSLRNSPEKIIQNRINTNKTTKRKG